MNLFKQLVKLKQCIDTDSGFRYMIVHNSEQTRRVLKTCADAEQFTTLINQLEAGATDAGAVSNFCLAISPHARNEAARIYNEETFRQHSPQFEQEADTISDFDAEEELINIDLPGVEELIIQGRFLCAFGETTEIDGTQSIVFALPQRDRFGKPISPKAVDLHRLFAYDARDVGELGETLPIYHYSGKYLADAEVFFAEGAAAQLSLDSSAERKKIADIIDPLAIYSSLVLPSLEVLAQFYLATPDVTGDSMGRSVLVMNIPEVRNVLRNEINSPGITKLLQKLENEPDYPYIMLGVPLHLRDQVLTFDPNRPEPLLRKDDTVEDFNLLVRKAAEGRLLTVNIVDEMAYAYLIPSAVTNPSIVDWQQTLSGEWAEMLDLVPAVPLPLRTKKGRYIGADANCVPLMALDPLMATVMCYRLLNTIG